MSPFYLISVSPLNMSPNFFPFNIYELKHKPSQFLHIILLLFDK